MRAPVESTAAQPEQGRWFALCLIAFAVILSLMTWFSATAVLPQLSEELDLSTSQMAWMTNAVQLGFAFGAITSSFFALSDSLPLPRYIASSAMIAAIANTLLLLDTGPAGAIAVRFVTGVALAGIYPPSMKLVASWFQAGRGLALGIMIGALTLGSAMPHLVRGLGSELAWHWIILCCSAGSLVAALLFFFFIVEGPYAFARSSVSLAHIRRVVGNRAVLLANAGYFGHMWELYAMWGWILAYISASAIGEQALLNVYLLTFSVIGAGALGCIAGGWLADRRGRCYTTALMMTISGLCALSIGLVYNGPVWILIVIALIWGFTVVADSAQFSTAVTELSEASVVGSSLALQTGLGFSITMVTIWLVPFIAELTGSWRWSFLILLPGPVLGVVAMLLLRREPAAVQMAQGKR